MHYIKSLSELNHTDLSMAGGKGANLGALLQAGFPVPPGYCITTSAYQAFVADNHLQEEIRRILETTQFDDPVSLEAASNTIRAAFADGEFPAPIRDEILASYTAINQNSKIQIPQFPVAVRSSATAEDLPDLSFAGQQDTYLNVQGEQGLLQAIINCWSSLWTARAIGYRARNNIPRDKLALAVVVQQMIPSQASGVLFTANPLSGLRSEMVIDATLGLGEALVSGQVEPDHYVVDAGQDKILSKTLGAKAVSLHGQPGGGIHAIEQNRTEIQALPDDQILALAQLGGQTATLFGFPQDIEWAWAEDTLYLLQSRPITSLFPLPANLPAEPLKAFFSFAAVQGMNDPITPVGRYTLRQIMATGSSLFGIHVLPESHPVPYDAGERLWANFTPLLKNSVGRRIIPAVLDMVEPTIRQAVDQIWDDPRLQPERPGIRLRSKMKIARFLAPLAVNVLLNLAFPQKRREYINRNGEHLLEIMETRAASITGDRWEKLAGRADLMPKFATEYLPHTFILFVSGVAAGMASWNALNILTNNAEGDVATVSHQDTHDLVMLVTRSMPYNPTTEMDLTLWRMAKEIQRDPPSRFAFDEFSPSELSERYLSGKIPELTRQAINRFLIRYGGRGLGEIDLGRKRWAEDPTHVFEMLNSFLQIVDETQAPDVVFARGVSSAQQAIDQLADIARKTHPGWLKARLVCFFAGRARQLMGMRENPKFFAVRMFYIIHRELLKSGQELVEAGELAQPDDVFYLSMVELKEMAVRGQKDWRGLITSRRDAYQRELLRRQIPRLFLSDGRTFYAGLKPSDDNEQTITGSPVSPGSAQGRVRVVLDPRQARLQPGEILVCPGTDPSWTPLFLSAAGLVMETGGMMTHGAVVAREYGIPAIVGVDRATARLQTGQLIRLDGSSGRIEILSSD